MSTTDKLAAEIRDKTFERLPGILAEAIPNLPVNPAVVAYVAEKLADYVCELVAARNLGADIEADTVIFVEK